MYWDMCVCVYIYIYIYIVIASQALRDLAVHGIRFKHYVTLRRDFRQRRQETPLPVGNQLNMVNQNNAASV
jgi:hypothetical protein